MEVSIDNFSYSDLLRVGYFKLAKNVSKYSNHRAKVGCVVSKKKPISVASNKVKTHPKCISETSKSTHAEIRAILNSGIEDLSGAYIYIYRETKDGKPALARPCNICYSFIAECGIKRIYYTVSTYPYWKMEKI